MLYQIHFIKPLEAEENFLRVLGIAVVALTKLFINDMINERKGE